MYPSQGMDHDPSFVPGNHFDKYHSRNPLHQFLLRGFLRSARELVAIAKPARILEVGCANGELASALLERRPMDGLPLVGRTSNPSSIPARITHPSYYLGTDLSEE